MELLGTNEWRKSPHIVGVAPRSIYGHDSEERAIAGAIECARGRIHPTYVVANRRVVGITHGRGPFSPDVRFTRLRHTYKSKWKDNEQLKSDMLHMAWTDANALINDITSGKFGRTYFAKAPTTTGVQYNWYDLWPVGGNPPPGSVAGTAKTAVAWTDTSTGALNHRGNVSTNTKHMLSKWGCANANTPMIMLYDRVISYDQNPYVATTNETMTNVATAARYNSGAPGLLIVMVTCTVNGATATNITQLRYTNQAGSTLQVMPTTQTVSIIPSGAAPTATLGARVIAPSSGATPSYGAFMPLASGDTGCQLVNDYTASASDTGTFTLVLMHPLTDLMLPVANTPFEMDCVYQISELEQIFDGACLALMAFTPTSAAFSVQGGIRFGWGA
jgi:hypothetical protein